MLLFLDFETSSKSDLSSVGAINYINDPSTEIACSAFSYGPDTDNLSDGFLIGDAPRDLLSQEVTVIAHNVFFEQCCLKKLMPDILTRKNITWFDTMALCTINNIRPGLNQACADLKIGLCKHADGAKVMRKLNKSHIYGDLTPQEKEDLKEYCMQDVKLSIEVYKKLISTFTASEQKVWTFTNRENWKGIRLDMDLVTKASGLLTAWKEKLPDLVNDLTNGEVQSVDQTGKLAKFLKINSVAKDFLVERLKTETNERFKKLMHLRLEGGKKSVSKFCSALLKQRDSKLFDIMFYHGASTGRFSSKGVQIHNLIKAPKDQSDKIIKKVKAGESFDYSKTPSYLSRAIRGMIVPEPGGLLIKADYAQVEARILAWVSDSHKLLKSFREGSKIYEEMASKIFNVPVEEVTPDQRFCGKSAILGCGYGMGHEKFSATYSIDESLALRCVTAYKKVNVPIGNLRRSLEKTIYDVVESGTMRKCAKCIIKRDSWRLFIILPSGRPLVYPYPYVKDNKIYHKTVKNKKFVEVSYWGGTFVENICQAISRDLLVWAMWHMRKYPEYKFMFTVHDELVYSCHPSKFDSNKLSDYILESAPPWAKGIPLDVEVETHDRYFK